jgi:transcriptional regulator with XRE-family HTH domain
MAKGSMGERIQAYRRRRGLSQIALAGLIGRSESWLSQVERGVRSVDRLSVLLDIARVLNVEVEALAGRPWQYAPNGSADVDSLAEVRRTFTRYDHLLGISTPSSVTLDALRAQVAAAHKNYQSAQYGRVVSELPRLLIEAERIRCEETATENTRDAAFAYVCAYVAAAKLVTKFGVSDLAILAADRAVNAASSMDSPVATGMAGYQVACALLRADQPQDAETLAVSLAELLTSKANSDAPTLVSLAGALWLIAAVTAARRTERHDAWERLDEADRLARVLGEDGNFGWTAFGPTNVAIHRVSVAAELGDAGEAVRLAGDVDPNRFPEGLTSRRAQLSLDLAWAQAQRKRDAEATLHLLEAERIAPETLRHNVIAQELIREMLARGSRSKTRALSDLAVRAGVLH